jgi:hypothetical protein
MSYFSLLLKPGKAGYVLSFAAPGTGVDHVDIRTWSTRSEREQDDKERQVSYLSLHAKQVTERNEREKEEKKKREMSYLSLHLK